jgi:hypothetical protein
MAIYKFIKDEKGWYIDLQGSPFDRTLKGMVRGADTLLDILAEGRSEVRVDASTFPVEGYERLDRKDFVNFGFRGANYFAEKYKEKRINHNLWLCPVTLWVFLRYPKYIYYKVI